MKYFVISDVHSHYRPMIEALNTSGFDIHNKEHHLLVLGDLFDRGNEPIEVLEYLYSLYLEDKTTIILGNHDCFLIEFLEKSFGRTLFNIKFNGFGKTLEIFSGLKPTEDNLSEIHDSIQKKYSFLYKWLKTFPLYLEIGDYIFVHGGIDGRLNNWKKMSSVRDFVWGREFDLEQVPGKTVVAGHQRVATIRSKTSNYHFLFLDQPEMFDIMYLEGKILIDRFVEISNEINVLIIEI